MNNITLNKIAGASYRTHAFKVYEARRNGELIGMVESDYGMGWNVKDASFNQVSRHSTIKAAVRVAARAL